MRNLHSEFLFLALKGNNNFNGFFFCFKQESTKIPDQVRLMIALGPVAKVGHMKSPIRFLSPFVKEIEYLFWLMGVNEFVPSNR